MTISRFYIALVTACLSVPTAADVNSFGEPEGFTFGLGVIADWPAYEGADTPSTTTVPYIAYDWENAHLGVDGFSYDFLALDNIEVSALLEPRWSFADPEDSPLFEDIERDTALEAGLSATFELGPVYVSGTLLQDVSGVHDGFEGATQVGFSAQLGPFELDAALGYVYRDEKLMLHLYGVRDDEERDGLETFEPDVHWSPFLTADLMYPINESTAVLVFGRYERLGNRAADSPLVRKDRDANVGVVLLKRF